MLGRHIYAVGSNPEAAHLSGISVKKITYIVFCSMGMLSALSGILFTARMQSATTTAGTLFELDAIAAAYRRRCIVGRWRRQSDRSDHRRRRHGVADEWHEFARRRHLVSIHDSRGRARTSSHFRCDDAQKKSLSV